MTCEICGTLMLQRQCKIRCPNCGFTRDCSDPYKGGAPCPDPLGVNIS